MFHNSFGLGLMLAFNVFQVVVDLISTNFLVLAFIFGFSAITFRDSSIVAVY